jgi:hypothetical protein
MNIFVLFRTINQYNMKIIAKSRIILVLALLFHCVDSVAQNDSLCAIKIGGNYYINCKKLIVFEDYSVLNINSLSEKHIGVNLDIYSTTGEKIAVVKNGAITEGDESLFTIKSTGAEYSIMENASDRII